MTQPETVPTQPEIVPQLLAELGAATAADVLALAVRRFPGRVAFASSLGLEDQVLTHMIVESKLDIPIFTLDTGRLFPETYDLIDRTHKRYGVTIHTYFPAAAEVEKMVDRDGVNLFRDSIEARKRCCEVRKILPLRRAQLELDAWVCGLRTGQGATRQKVEVIEWDNLADMVKINPLADWTEQAVRDYVDEHDVPYNPLHDQGFPSIGCAPCTRAVAEGEDARAGRWWWEAADHRECGLHHRGAAAEPLETAQPGS
jgi:phosphoadenosine phosphosulfate reductase